MNATGRTITTIAVLTVLVAGVAPTAAAATGDESADAASPGGVGPLADLPGPVPEFVGELLGAVGEFLAGLMPGESATDGGSGEDVESFPTETPTRTPTPSESDAETAPATPEPAPDVAFTVDRIETCGRTCRDVTSTVTNDGSAAATDVTVYTRIYAGKGTDGDVVWEGRERVGSLGAGESSTTTERVDLSLADAVTVESADGWVTVQTTIQSDEETVTVTQRRQVG
jgi:hypothetical protein